MRDNLVILVLLWVLKVIPFLLLNIRFVAFKVFRLELRLFASMVSSSLLLRSCVNCFVPVSFYFWVLLILQRLVLLTNFLLLLRLVLRVWVLLLILIHDLAFTSVLLTHRSWWLHSLLLDDWNDLWVE